MLKKTKTALLISLLIWMAADTSALYRTDEPSSSGYEPTGLIVKLKPDAAAKIIVGKDGRVATGLQSLDALNQRSNISGLAPLLPKKAAGTVSQSFSGIFILEFPDGTDLPALATEYARLSSVMYAEPDYVVE
ncbi:MAG: hypothetical protein JSU69_01245, partial [Candidatus Zixiibacteriota bacterium]